MNKLTIPAILVATVMVAGIFAFMPVEQASTVHTTIQGTQAEVRTVSDTIAEIVVGANTVTVTCNAPFQVLNVNIDSSDVTGDDTYLASAPTIDEDGAGAKDAIVLNAANFDSRIAAAAASTEAITTFLTSVAVGTDGTVSVTYTGVTAEVDTLTADWHVITTSGATCS